MHVTSHGEVTVNQFLKHEIKVVLDMDDTKAKVERRQGDRKQFS